MQYKTILITGGAGFVGSNLAIKFKERYSDIKVIALDNLRRRGSELNLVRLKRYGVEFIHGDIRNREDLESIGYFDLMIECSAEPSVLSGYNESPEYLINTNLIGTINCLEMLRKNKADIIFLSTSRVYPIKTLNSLEYEELETRFELKLYQSIKGVSQKGITEEFPLNGIRSLYGTTKLASELLIQEYIGVYGIRGVINRCGVLTGPWQMGKVEQGFVVLWVAKHIYGGELCYIGYKGTGKQVRDILHIDDLYNLIEKQILNIHTYNGQIFNIGGGRNISVSLKELTQICQDVTGNKIEIKSIPDTRFADIPYYITDYTKAQTEIGWIPKYSVREIIEEIARWIYDNKELLSPILA
ncbi:NAD-dependent epimerase/dehydratase family protein [Thermodesulfovibrio yellowstonii]|uniref:CDP tyvulose epimerase n=1 Tax=Thermodesulfovibrio yellowstonii (strain ATCC 51303 / DSM 11347 / YP87) TaxID=289376 RepID=B5YJA3_THEYD|nr:NAD-dependent epimerase/dehydratase family protein [Thermodesulfovibrio yellowstonii]ACI21426.1 putative CDP tyvulose epimerase [Thermodesulfovibrio yellowstonii DSM 11347]